MSKALILVGGGKGGVGKSLFSMAVVDFLESTGANPFLVETDTSVPDVFKTYRETVGGELVNLVESKQDNSIVINTGARNQTGITNFGRTLRKALPELKRKLGVFWLIDRKRESLELLGDFAEALPEAEIHVVRNLYLGAESKFELYNGSKMRTAIEKAGGRSLSFPELADRVTDAMNKGRLTIAKACKELSFGDRIEVERWRDECKEMLLEAIHE